MRYLLDVNALVAFGFSDHIFHARVSHWVANDVSKTEDDLVTCAITELGFIRILAQVPEYGMRVVDSRLLLKRIKDHGTHRFSFVADDMDSSPLPTWVKGPNQVTDGYLVRLAEAHNSVLATLDGGIPGTFLIPE